MANPEKLFRDALVADATVAGLISDRAYFFNAPQGAAKPYVVLHLISSTHDNMIGEADTIPTARIQVDVVAENVGSMGDVRNAVRERMNVFSNSAIASSRLQMNFVDYDEATEYPRAVMEFRVSYHES